jgi:ATP-dependent Lhr-like helicase
MALLLKNLAAKDLVTQGTDGTLYLGAAGERIVEHYSFYAAFATPDEYRLTASGRALGTLPVSYPVTVGLHLVFAGRRWRVLTVDDARKVIDLAPARGGRLPIFGGLRGRVHDEVRRAMLKIYMGSTIPAYLDASAGSLLLEARTSFHRMNLSRRSIIREDDAVYLFPWTGDRAAHTLALQLRNRGLECSPEGGLVLRVDKTDESKLQSHLEALKAEGSPDVLELVSHVANKRTQKYSPYLGDELLSEEYAISGLDPAGAVLSIERLLDHTQLAEWAAAALGKS